MALALRNLVEASLTNKTMSRPELIYKGVARNSGVQPLFKAITGFLGGVTADADDATKNALQMVR